jgi:Uncharacterized protein conserved in bacteria
MDILLIILAGLCLLIGLLGSVLPILPGVPISYIGILLLHFTSKVQFSTEFLIFWAVIVVLIQVLDYFIPIWGTKKFGGTKIGVWGSVIGMIVGLFFGPWGIILGPFVGAIVGELIAGKETKLAVKAGFGAFIGFLFGTIAKLIVGGFLIYYYVEALVK